MCRATGVVFSAEDPGVHAKPRTLFAVISVGVMMIRLSLPRPHPLYKLVTVIIICFQKGDVYMSRQGGWLGHDRKSMVTFGRGWSTMTRQTTHAHTAKNAYLSAPTVCVFLASKVKKAIVTVS
jgi:hypothetical protein